MIDPPPEPPEEPREPEGRLQPTSPTSLAVWGVAGMLCGLALHVYANRYLTSAPLVSWLQPLTLFLVAAILGVTARATWRVVGDPHQRLEPHQAVNRLVLARACAYVGMLVAGGYLAYALGWLGDPAELPEQRAVRSFVAALGGACVVGGALVLERACRVRKDEDGP
jgi:hypothetical protein